MATIPLPLGDFVQHVGEPVVARSLRIVIPLVALMVVSVTFWMLVRTYTVVVSVRAAEVMWNDEQVAVFVLGERSGTSTAMLQPLANHVVRLLSLPDLPIEQQFSRFTTVLRFDHGQWQKPIHSSAKALPGYGRWIDTDRRLVFGDSWNGREVPSVATDEYFRLLRAEPADEEHQWHEGGLLIFPGTSELTVQVRGEAVTLRGSRDERHASIELVRTGMDPIALYDERLGFRAVGAGEYDASFVDTPAR